MSHPAPSAKATKRISDDVLVEIFDICRVDNRNPNQYPLYWWYKFAHVCREWRRILLESPNRLGVTLICTHRTPVADLLAHSPSLPIIVYYGNPEPLDKQGNVKDILLALQHPERVCRINLHLPSSSMHAVFKSMQGPFHMLETLQLYCSSLQNENATLPSTFEAPNLRHLQMSDFMLVPQQLPPLTTTICPSSLVTFSLGEISPVKYESPALFAECLAIMPQLKRLKIGYLFPVKRRRRENRSNREASHSRVVLTNLEEFQFKGESDYLEALSARIDAPSLKKLSITFTDAFTRPEFPLLLELINGAADLSFQFARLRFKDNLSLVMDHEELWTGRGAFELIFGGGTMQDTLTSQQSPVMQVLGMLEFKLSTIKSLLLEHAQPQRRKLDVDRAMLHRVLPLFGNLETLRVANEFVNQLDSALQPGANDEESVRILLPKLRKIVCNGPEKNFKDFVASRRRAGMDVEVEIGPRNRLSLV